MTAPVQKKLLVIAGGGNLARAERWFPFRDAFGVVIATTHTLALELIDDAFDPFLATVVCLEPAGEGFLRKLLSEFSAQKTGPIVAVGVEDRRKLPRSIRIFPLGGDAMPEAVVEIIEMEGGKDER